MSNKIKYGISQCHYAVASIGSTGAATYQTPVALPGATSLALDPQGARTPFYADNIEYYVSNSNTGYDGNLTLAKVPDSFKKDCLGYLVDNKGMLLENQNATPVHFALIFQFEGDVKATRHVMYNCTASRVAANGETKGESIEPQTEEISISVSSIYNTALDKWLVKAETTDSTGTTEYNSFTTAVYQPAALAV